MPKVKILRRYCKGCGLCVSVCPTGAMVLSNDIGQDGVRYAEVRGDEECKGCGLCYLMCPDAAVLVEEGKA